MKIEIETKFDISDIVWIPEFTGTETGFQPSKCRISLIDIQIYYKAIKVIRYFIAGIDKCYYESDLFMNRNVCLAECDRLNKGLMNSSEREDLELIRMRRMLSSDEQMEIYKSAFDKLPKDQK